MKLFYLSLLVTFSLSSSLQAAFEFDKLFQSGMVIQQNKPIFFFGKETQKDAEIVIAFGNKKSKKFKPNADGTWMVEFKPIRGDKDKRKLVANIKYKDAKAQRRELKDITIGDVWLIAGQKNLKLKISGLPAIKTSLKGIDHWNLFMTSIKIQVKADPSEQVEYHQDFKGRWQRAKDEDAFYNLNPFAYYFGRELAAKSKGFIGTIQCSTHGPINSWLPNEALTELGISKNIVREANGDLRSNSTSSTYNGMIHSLRRLNFRGVIWFHGDHGEYKADQYGQRLSAMIKSWRQKFQDPSLPFIFVQPPASKGPSIDKSGQVLAWIRDAQRDIDLKVAGTGLVISTDTGLSLNPKTANLEVLAQRTAQWALNVDKKTRPVNPTRKKISSAGSGKFMLKFNKNMMAKSINYEFDKTTIDKDKPTGFSMAGVDQVFHPAQAKISGNKILIWSPQVSKPRAIRYAWKNLPKANIFSTDGLPLVPFRTDSFLPPAFDGSVMGREISMKTTTGSPMHINENYPGVIKKDIADGKGLVITDSEGKGVRKIFAKTFSSQFMNAKTKKVEVTIVYFDGYKGKFEIYCDTSSYTSKRPMPSAKIIMTGSQKWLYSTFSLSNARFNKQIYKNDILLKSTNSDFLIGGVYLRPSQK